MELIRRNIHMDRTRVQAVTQFTLEDDLNIPENKPDVNVLNLEKGEIVVEEIKPGTDFVTVRGKMDYAVLYHTMEEGSSLVLLEGKIPFEERVNMESVTPQDTVTVDGKVEDITVNMINSRKLNVQALLTLKVRVDELYDVEIPVDIRGEDKVEYRRVPMDLAQISICKNDIFRLKEEVTLPSSYPNIFQILWNDITLGDVEFKALEEKISISGDIHIFVLYEGEGEEHPCRFFETTLPFSGVLECHGCREGMLPDIRYRIGQMDLSIRPDFDGEERNIGLEMLLDICIRIYEEERMEMLTDIYGVSREVNTVNYPAKLRKLLSRVTGKTKVVDRVHIKGEPVMQLLHSEGTVSLEQQTVVENGIMVQGSIQMKIMYITGADETPYGSTKAQIPYMYVLEATDVSPEDMGEVQPALEQLQVTMLDGEEMDVKAVLSFSTIIFKQVPVDVIGQVNVSDLDYDKLNQLPGIVVYTVKNGDNLWNIGKKYYINVDTLRELNNLESDELKVGQKILVVKGM